MRPRFVLLLFVLLGSVLLPGRCPSEEGPADSLLAPQDPTPESEAMIAARQAIAKFDTAQLQRLLRLGRRELRNRSMLDELRKKVPTEEDLERIAHVYGAGRNEHITGIDVRDDEALRNVLRATVAALDSLGVELGGNDLKIVYEDAAASGDDHRPYVLPEEEETLTLARSVVAIIDRSAFSGLELTIQHFEETQPGSFHFCDFVGFYGLPATTVHGSGFLIPDDQVVTAGHVTRVEGFLDSVYFVFGYVMLDSGTARTTFAPEQIYEGESILYPLTNENGRDYAVVKLKSSPEDKGYAPLEFRLDGWLDDKDEVYTIGHPLGLPQMHSGPSALTENRHCIHFDAELDVYQFSSGSPVFNAETHVVEGVLGKRDSNMEKYCGCDAPTSSSASKYNSDARAMRSTALVGPLLHPDRIFITNTSSVVALVRTDQQYPIEPGEEKDVPFSSPMLLEQPFDPTTAEESPENDCQLSYYSEPGERWSVVDVPGATSLIMVRCVDDAEPDSN